MLLSGSVNMGAPEWLDSAYIYVASHGGDTITPDIEFKGYSIDFSVENLFGDNVSSPNCTMRGFEITECGDEETPDVVLNLTLRCGFSSKLWNWLGQFVGEDVWARFVPGEAGGEGEGEEDGTLLDDGENDEQKADLDPDNEHDGPTLVRSGKSGPKDLATFHEGEVAKEEKKRPKKSVVAGAF